MGEQSKIRGVWLSVPRAEHRRILDTNVWQLLKRVLVFPLLPPLLSNPYIAPCDQFTYVSCAKESRTYLPPATQSRPFNPNAHVSTVLSSLRLHPVCIPRI